jgi:peptidoglycan lytic transglycosylase F
MGRQTLLLFLLSLLLAGCTTARDGGSLEKIRERGTLIVLTRNAPTTYYEGRDGLQGLEYEMATAFADHLGVKAEFHVMDTLEELLAATRAGKGDLAAAGLTRTEGRADQYLAGPAYQYVEQQVVCRRGGPRPKNVKELGTIELKVVADSSYVERLQQLQQRDPNLVWTADEALDTEQLLEQVWKRSLDCTVADSNIVAINRRYYPELVVAFDLTKPEPLAWLLPPDADELREAVVNWFNEYEDDGNVAQLLQKYYGFIELFDFVDTRTYVRRVEEILPRYRRLFKNVADDLGLRWTLLAAQAYQESHWNPRAKSPTGVKGMMMLTLPTARAMGVKSRLNPVQSVRGGAKYLVRLRNRLPEKIAEPDRTWLALAAYNIGLGHLRDARTLARIQGRDPDLWSDLSEVLPLLARKRYYRTLKHGYARGSEPVQYVNHVRDYQDILEQSL